MKIKPEHREIIEKAIQRVLNLNPHIVEKYELGQFQRSDKVKDLNKRFRWDLFHAINPKISETTSAIYKYANDDHIDTVLRNVCPTITRKY